MVNVVLTPKSKTMVKSGLLPASNFATNSTSPVDVTGFSASIPNGYTVGITFQDNLSAGAYNYQYRMVLGSINGATQAPAVPSNANYRLACPPMINNTGAAQTAKLQVWAGSVASQTVMASQGMVVYSQYCNLQTELPIKASVTSISIFELSGTQTSCMCVGSVGDNLAETVILVNANVQNGILFSNANGTCLFDWDGYAISVTP